jgi:glycyl-tRNA synthetase beta subunit
VMVMVDDDEVRSNRLRLLQDLRILFVNVADIAQMAVSK